MSILHLVRVGETGDRILEELRADLSGVLRVRCEILPGTLDSGFAFHPQRQQVCSTAVLQRMGPLARADTWRLLGVTSADLFIPVLTFVFGEAQVGDSCALVSFHRLCQQFYGLPADAALERERLLKEAVHELGHTLGLAHCGDYRCAMAPSHAVEWIDVKGRDFCAVCRGKAFAAWG